MRETLLLAVGRKSTRETKRFYGRPEFACGLEGTQAITVVIDVVDRSFHDKAMPEIANGTPVHLSLARR